MNNGPDFATIFEVLVFSFGYKYQKHELKVTCVSQENKRKW